MSINKRATLGGQCADNYMQPLGTPWAGVLLLRGCHLNAATLHFCLQLPRRQQQQQQQ